MVSIQLESWETRLVTNSSAGSMLILTVIILYVGLKSQEHSQFWLHSCLPEWLLALVNLPGPLLVHCDVGTIIASTSSRCAGIIIVPTSESHFGT